jgi:uncharacterized membrane protein YvbJ
MICSKCGANNLEGQTFCGSCGSPLGNTASTFVEPQDHYQKEEKPYTTPGSPSNGGMVRPKSYQTESIIVTVVSILCCGSLPSLIIGIIAILKASRVDADFNAGNVHEAIQNSESAKKLTIWAAAIAVVWAILIAALYVCIFFFYVNTSESSESIIKGLGM